MSASEISVDYHGGVDLELAASNRTITTAEEPLTLSLTLTSGSGVVAHQREEDSSSTRDCLTANSKILNATSGTRDATTTSRSSRFYSSATKWWQQQQHHCSFSFCSLATTRKFLVTCLIVVIGALGSVAFLVVAVTGAQSTQQVLFAQRSTDVAHAIQHAWDKYELYGLWVHDACIGPTTATTTAASSTGRLQQNNSTTTPLVVTQQELEQELGICSYERFQQSYEYIQSLGTQFQAIQLLVNLTHEQRPRYEQRSRLYYQQSHPDTVNYTGLKGFIPKHDGSDGLQVVPMWDEPFYFALHHLAPVAGNEAAIDLNIYSHPTNRHMIDAAVQTWRPVLSPPGRLVQETQEHAFGVVLMHPGYPASTHHSDIPHALAQVVIRIPDLLANAARHSSVSVQVVIFDATDNNNNNNNSNATTRPLGNDDDNKFMGGIRINVLNNGTVYWQSTPTISLTSLIQDAQRYEERTLTIANRSWRVVVVPVDDTFEPRLVFIIMGGCCILVATIVLAIWFHAHMERMAKLNAMKRKAEQEKSAIILRTARQQAVAEAQLNDFIAHEVRNPLSSAIAALSFITATIGQIRGNAETCQLLQEDASIVDASLQFINELMRNMLDMRRASSKKMKIELCHVDVQHDILQAVASILYLRGRQKVQVQVQCCPENIVVESDKLHLKQIILNLAANASKFVEEGFIRLRADVHMGSVRLFVEDSGPGIPTEKKGKLFAKFQDSLDILNQGTGIGLCLCKHLADLMGCDISLDESFNSGIPGFPGTRFILDLHTPPLISVDHTDDNNNDGAGPLRCNGVSTNGLQYNGFDSILDRNEPECNRILPDKLQVLFVDDDLVLRKMFSRAVKRVAPGWTIEEAANGETALHFVEDHTYDLIFLDQYMASVQKQLTGTETARALRGKGVASRICGLSANDLEEAFLEAGADHFLFKPFPCEPMTLRRTLLDAYFGQENSTTAKASASKVS